MTSSRIEKVDENFVQPAATQLDAIASKDEQIEALITSVQDLKQQLASAQQHLTANEITIKNMSAKFKTLEDGLDATRLELNATTITGRQMKDELTKQCEENLEALTNLVSSASQHLNETFMTAQRNISASNVQIAERMKNVLGEVTMIKEELAQEVIAIQHDLESTTQKLEKKLTSVKEEIQTCHSEARKTEDNHTQSLASIEAKLTASQLVSQREEGKVSGKLTQQIKNIKQNLLEIKEGFNQKLTHVEGDVTAFRDEMEKGKEELKVVKQEWALQVTISHNKLKGNLNFLNFAIVLTFAVVLAFLFLPYNKLALATEKIEMTSYQDEMRNLQADLLSKMYTLSNDQGLQIQEFNDTLNAIQLQMVSESELVELLSKIISAVNQTTLSIVNDLRVHYDHKIMTMRAYWSYKVNKLKNDLVFHLERIRDIERDNNVTVSFMQIESKAVELVAKLHENISAINKTALRIVDDLIARYDHEITEMRNLVTNLSSKIDTLKDDQVLQLQKLIGIEEDLNITRSRDVQDEIKIGELVVELHKNISAVNETTLSIVNDVKAFCNHENMRMRNLIKDWSLKVIVLRNNQGLHSQRLDDIERDINVTTSFMQLESKTVELVAKLHENISAVNMTALRIGDDLRANHDNEIVKLRNILTNLSSKVDAINNDQVLQLQKLASIEEDLNITRSHDMQDEIKIDELVFELQKNISTVNETTLKFMNDVKAFCGHENMRMRSLIKDWSLKVRNDQVLHSQRLDDIEGDINATKLENKLLKLVTKLHDSISAVNDTALVGISELNTQQILLHCLSDYRYQRELTIKALQLEKSLAKVNDYASFPVIVMVSGSSSMVNSSHVHNYHWANASVNIRRELVFLSLQKINNAHFEVIVCEPLLIWCDDLILRNQINAGQ